MTGKDFSILTKEELLVEKRERKREFNTKSVPLPDVASFVEEGWIIDRNFKKTSRLKRSKLKQELFINKLWLLFYDMGFNEISKTSINIDGLEVDIVSSDDETLLFIFTNFSDKKQNKKSLLNEIKQINEHKSSLIKWGRGNFPEKKKKCAFIFATQNYILPDQDTYFMEKYGITHFDEETFLYYKGLSTHLGKASRYQFLGLLFSGQKIQSMDNKIPAIEGRMGGHKYYSFSIEPEKLLKIAYVLHRNNANKDMMPTYQRLIKKDRIKAIREFISEGGFFPNSLIINLDTNGKKLRFDMGANQVEEAISKIGILHLPQLYRSAYIIDGQHRLYGYSNLNFSESNSIPVVAFENLNRKEQIKLFMDINENQKSVSKNLRNTLNSDLLWESDSLNERKTALKLVIAHRLGDDRSSSLYDRILVGENSRTDYCSITIDSIKNALDDCSFFGEYSRNNELISIGTLDKESNKETSDIVFNYLKECLWYVKSQVGDNWETTEKDKMFIVTNPGIYSLIRIIDDITNDLMARSLINLDQIQKKENLNLVFDYLDYLIDYYKSVTLDERKKIKKNYGGGGKIKYWRTLQKEISKRCESFCPEGMNKYWEENDMRYNDASYNMIRDIELYIKGDCKEKLQNEFGDVWFKKGLPKKVYQDANSLAVEKNYDKKSGEEVSPWDCLNFINYREIVLNNWQNIFEKDYTLPEDKKKSGKKTDKTKWMEKISRIRNEQFHQYSVTEEEFQFLEKIHTWLLKDNKYRQLGF